METQITIFAEVNDPETYKDALDILNKILPYIFDNVVVTSSLLDPREEVDQTV